MYTTKTKSIHIWRAASVLFGPCQRDFTGHFHRGDLNMPDFNRFFWSKNGIYHTTQALLELQILLDNTVLFVIFSMWDNSALQCKNKVSINVPHQCRRQCALCRKYGCRHLTFMTHTKNVLMLKAITLHIICFFRLILCPYADFASS